MLKVTQSLKNEFQGYLNKNILKLKPHLKLAKLCFVFGRVFLVSSLYIPIINSSHIWGCGIKETEVFSRKKRKREKLDMLWSYVLHWTCSSLQKPFNGRVDALQRRISNSKKGGRVVLLWNGCLAISWQHWPAPPAHSQSRLATITADLKQLPLHSATNPSLSTENKKLWFTAKKKTNPGVL